MKPMLAFNSVGRDLTYPIYVQPKLNGIRMLTRSGILQSRDEIQWSSSVLPHLLTELRRMPDFMYDGELYAHGMSLQEINKRVAVKRLEPHADVAAVKYVIFDIVSPHPFSQRAEGLKKLTQIVNELNLRHIEICPTYLAANSVEASHYFNEWIANGYEGLMYRDPHAHYGFQHLCGNKENRWKCLLKRKPTFDDEVTIIGAVEGNGKHSGRLGTLTVKMRDGQTLDIGTGFSDHERKMFWTIQDKLIGLECRILYADMSDDGVPLQARFDQLIDVPF